MRDEEDLTLKVTKPVIIKSVADILTTMQNLRSFEADGKLYRIDKAITQKDFADALNKLKPKKVSIDVKPPRTEEEYKNESTKFIPEKDSKADLKTKNKGGKPKLNIDF